MWFLIFIKIGKIFYYVELNLMVYLWENLFICNDLYVLRNNRFDIK